MCVGHTLGEETLLSPQTAQRHESIVANDYACVLQLNIQTFELMRAQRHVGAGGASLTKDWQLLVHILESHFVQKNQWRVGAGVLKTATGSSRKKDTSFGSLRFSSGAAD